MTASNGRRNTRSAAANGSSVNKTNSDKTKKHKKKSAIAKNIAQEKRLTQESLGTDKGHITNLPTPMYKPYVTPGVRGTPGKNLYVGNLSPDKVQQPNNKYRFTFHWNPATIDIDTSTSANTSVAPKATYQQGARNLFATMTSYSFQFMIERQEEVASGATLGRPTLLQYGSNLFQGVKATTFTEIGTLYDLEILYLVINGPQKQTALTPQQAPAISAPYILANPLYCTFGRSSQFFGYCSNLSINHIMFTAAMVPTVTYVQLTFNAYSLANVYGDESATKKLDKEIIHPSKHNPDNVGPPKKTVGGLLNPLGW